MLLLKCVVCKSITNRECVQKAIELQLMGLYSDRSKKWNKNKQTNKQNNSKLKIQKFEIVS